MDLLNKNPELNNFDIFFYALGGLGEIGKNMYIFEIEQKIFIVDSGISFLEILF